jgi:hypothetical protein
VRQLFLRREGAAFGVGFREERLGLGDELVAIVADVGGTAEIAVHLLGLHMASGESSSVDDRMSNRGS